MDLLPHLHPAAAAAGAIAGYALELPCRLRGRPSQELSLAAKGNTLGALRSWVTGIASVAATALVMAEVLARLGIASYAGGALGGLALGAGLYAAPRLAEGGWSGSQGLTLGVCRMVQFAVMGAMIGGLH